jgi:hypothetical protein
MPYLDPEARRKAHRASDIRHRARILAYRKRGRLAALWASYGGELGYLVAEQARDARTYRIKYGPAFLDVSSARLVA